MGAAGEGRAQAGEAGTQFGAHPHSRPLPPTPPQVVEPKIAKLRESEAELKVATRERQAVEEELAVVQARLDAMQTQFDAAMAQKQVGEWAAGGG